MAPATKEPRAYSRTSCAYRIWLGARATRNAAIRAARGPIKLRPIKRIRAISRMLDTNDGPRRVSSSWPIFSNTYKRIGYRIGELLSVRVFVIVSDNDHRELLAAS